MLTKMTEEDWVLVLEVFDACRSRRGEKGRGGRKFLEALHYFTVRNITWRALPARTCPSYESSLKPIEMPRATFVKLRASPWLSGRSKNDALDITHPNPFGGKGPYRLGPLAHWRSTLNEKENP